MGTVAAQLESLDGETREVFAAIYARATALAPDAVEGTSYGMPALLHRGKGLLALQRTKSHLSLFPFSGSVVDRVAARLEGFSLSKGTIRFSLDQRLPDDVVDDVVRLRLAEIDGR